MERGIGGRRDIIESPPRLREERTPAAVPNWLGFKLLSITIRAIFLLSSSLIWSIHMCSLITMCII